jgi:putative intracellular protease/amidase
MCRNLRLCLYCFGAVIVAPTYLFAQETRTRNVAFVVWEGLELIEFAGPAQMFYFTPGYREYTVAETRKPINSYFVTITPEFTFDDCPKPDVIVIAAGGRRARSDKLYAWLREHVPRAEAVLSVCNGSVILANSGVLNGHRATSPMGNLDDLRIGGENVTPILGRRFVESGKFVTCDSYFAGVDGALHLIAKLSGEDPARRSAERNLYEWRPEKFAAQEGVVPKSRRYDVFKILQADGVDAAVMAYRASVSSGEPAYTPPLDQVNEENMFRWSLWNLLDLERFDEALKMAEFSTVVWENSPMAWSCLAEAHTRAGQPDEALPHFFKALNMQSGQPHALRWLKEATGSPRMASNDDSRRGRRILRANAPTTSTVIAPENEPGEPMVVTGTIKNDSGEPIAGALVHAYHTDTRGYYSTGGMDEANPRLFAYVVTAADGRFALTTIRPGHYPDTPEEPVEQHIHFELSAEGYKDRIARLGFADDPFWEQQGRPVPRWARPVAKDEWGTARCELEIVMERE